MGINMDETEKKYLHKYTLEQFINDVSLYYKIPISLGPNNNTTISTCDIDMFNSIFVYNTNIMSYCLECKCLTAFTPISSKYFELINTELKNRISLYRESYDLPQTIISYHEYYSREYKCAYNNSHSLIVDCKLIQDGNELAIIKIGQYPSVADLQFPEVRKYRKIMGDDYYKEFTKAIGLYANGIGVGSFVYLRRIYENLIEEIHNEYAKKPEWVDTEYTGKKFNQKVEYLESLGVNIFPEEINDIKTQIYGVISKGIHEYEEKECMTLFEPLKFCIAVILDHKYEKNERRKKAESARIALQSKK